MDDLLLDMLSKYGMKEVDGKDSNPEILAMFKELGYDVKDDSTTAWCSAALSYFAKKNGYEYHKGLDARGWLKMPVKVLKPWRGVVVVLWRNSPDSWEGHTGLFISWNDKYVFVLAGNQNNTLNIQAFPRDRVLGFRELRKL
jgi:uncharacterized protein (TIGR02594 family)